MTQQNTRQPKPISELPKNAWLGLDSFIIEGRATRGRPDVSEPAVVAQWHMPARFGLRVAGMILRQVAASWFLLLKQNAKVALRWLFWRI